MNTIGVGLVRRGGNYYAVEDFADGVAELGPEQIEQKIGQLLQQRGLQPAGIPRTPGKPAKWSTAQPGFQTPVHHALGGNGSTRFRMCWSRKSPPANTTKPR